MRVFNNRQGRTGSSETPRGSSYEHGHDGRRGHGDGNRHASGSTHGHMRQKGPPVIVRLEPRRKSTGPREAVTVRVLDAVPMKPRGSTPDRGFF